jgi:hypothetical protein
MVQQKNKEGVAAFGKKKSVYKGTERSLHETVQLQKFMT